MNSYRINSNYAKALLMLASEVGDIDRVAEDMRLVGSVATANRELASVFSSPVVKADKKAAILRDLFADHVGEATMAFLVFVVRKNRTANLAGISEAYLDLWRGERGIVLSDFVSYQPIDDSAREMVARIVGDYTGRKVELQDRTDARMLGGFKLEFDHNMYDARIRTKIRKLRREFARNDYESKL